MNVTYNFSSKEQLTKDLYTHKALKPPPTFLSKFPYFFQVALPMLFRIEHRSCYRHEEFKHIDLAAARFANQNLTSSDVKMKAIVLLGDLEKGEDRYNKQTLVNCRPILTCRDDWFIRIAKDVEKALLDCAKKTTRPSTDAV